MRKFFIGLVVGAAIAFVLGFNFGRDVPLWTNPFTAKSDLSQRVAERTEKTLEHAKEAVHEATKPGKEKR